MSYNNIQTIDDILSMRYPSREELLNFPLGDELEKLDRMLWTDEMRCIELNLQDSEEKKVYDLILKYPVPNTNDEKKKELDNSINDQLRKIGRILKSEKIVDIFQSHIVQCMEGIRFLTQMQYDKFFINPISGYEPYVSFQTNMARFKHEEKQILRIVALYHDIGKVIHRDKHPILGQHLLESLNDNERKRFIEIFTDEKYFYTMLDMVGHHDLFGTLCTGEASRTAFIEASGLRLRKIDDAEKIIDFIAILNMADIYGTMGPLPNDRMQMILDDWYSYKSMLEDLLISKKDLENKLVESEQEPEKTIERIRRIVASGILYGDENLYDKNSRLKLAQKITPDLIRNTLVKELGPELQSFCRDFALVCKLDYTLRFIKTLCDQWINKNIITKKNDNDYRPESLVTIILDILIRLVRCYSDLTSKRDGGSRRIGLEFIGLSRSKEISNQVIILLISDERKSEGVNWIADETTAWYYI